MNDIGRMIERGGDGPEWQRPPDWKTYDANQINELYKRLNEVTKERDLARQIATMLWRDDIAYSASKVLEQAPWLEEGWT